MVSGWITSTLVLCTGQSRVIDSYSREALPFATVYNIAKPHIMTTTDINGYFMMDTNCEGDSILLTYIGYDSLYTIYTGEPTEIYLNASDQDLEEVVIKAKDDPAIAVIKKVLKNRSQHNIENLPFYQTKIYNKLSIRFDTPKDSVKMDNPIDKQVLPSHFFITESLTNRQYEYKHKVYEQVVATEISGLDEANFAITADDVQNLHFYKDYIVVFNKDYLNPISPLSWLKYTFNLDRIYEENGDSMYLIHYWPKADRFNCFKGMMVISGNGWAVQKIKMQNAMGGVYPFLMYQEYSQIGSQWFPEKFILELTFPSAAGSEYPFKLNNISIFDSTTFEKKPLQSGQVNKVEMGTNVAHRLDGLRMIDLEDKEIDAYTFGNQVMRYTPLGFIARNMGHIINFELPVGPVAIDLLNLYKRNNFERNRMGLRLVSNRNTWPHLSLSAYAAWGTADQTFKYGGGFMWYFDRLRKHGIGYQYTDDIAENDLFRFRNTWYDRYFSNYFTASKSHSINFTSQIKSFAIKLEGRNQQIRPLYDYHFNVLPTEDYENINLSEVNFSVEYSKGKQVNFFNTWYMVRDIAYPIIQLRINSGRDKISSPNFQYTAVDLAATKVFRWSLLGRTIVTVEGGYIAGEAPFFRLYNAPASLSGRLTLQVVNSFQTMPPNKYFGDRYFHFFTEHNFGYLYVTKFSSPELFIAYNVGWSALSNRSRHDYVEPVDYNKGFHEVGIGLNSIIRIPLQNWFAFGINAGGYYNTEGHKKPVLGDNFVLKLGLGFIF